MKPILAIVLAAGYLAALAEIVRHEGAEYRRDLARRRQSIAASPGPMPATAAPIPPAPASPPLPMPAVEAAPTPPPLPPTATAIDVGPRAVPPPPTSTTAASPLDLRRLSVEEARRLGAELSGLIASNHPLRDDPAAIRRLEGLLANLAPARSRPDEPIAFHLLDSAEVNAFSHLGGHVYVSRGLFALAQTDAELEFVVAHELAHLDLGHTAARLDAILRQSAVPPGLPLALYHLIAAGFSSEQEFQADEWAYQAMRRSGHSHRQSVLLLRRYAGHAEAHHLAGGRSPRTHLGDSRQDIENHSPAHPAARERLKRLESRRGG